MQVTDSFKPNDDCTLERAKKSGLSNEGVSPFDIFGERLIFDFISFLTPFFGSKKHWLLVMEDSTDYEWSCF